ncbi:conserved hypothetical protein [Candidatus Desulfarcum epimagneticum]|uniref:Cell division protein ZapB n=1 Tax=uncultured Desulfobacteraceae bacterium TaxID=218296 RepID=A0A484HL03_9BACT|nr:conserved hypothetical protein [uncultured Desulfobacteraceae bacterium]
MDKDVLFRRFEEIEARIARLIEERKTLKSANLEFSQKIGGLEKKLEEKILAEKAYFKEKELIKSKVDALLNRLENMA